MYRISAKYNGSEIAGMPTSVHFPFSFSRLLISPKVSVVGSTTSRHVNYALPGLASQFTNDAKVEFLEVNSDFLSLTFTPKCPTPPISATPMVQGNDIVIILNITQPGRYSLQLKSGDTVIGGRSPCY